LHDQIQVRGVVGIHIIAGRTDQGSANGGIEFRDRLEKRIEKDVRNLWIEEAVEALDEANDFDSEFGLARA